jgi:hypothetical protein
MPILSGVFLVYSIRSMLYGVCSVVYSLSALGILLAAICGLPFADS